MIKRSRNNLQKYGILIVLTDMGGKFKFQAQDSFLEYFFERLGDLKKESHFLKKGTFTQGRASGSF